MNSQQQELFTEFFKIFSKPVVKPLMRKLDKDICKKISFSFNSFTEIKDAEELKKDNTLYKLEYATGKRQGNIALLIPEELLANISDILTGGDGKNVYKGSLSEIETNSVAPILTEIFREAESNFSHTYNHDLVFSANSHMVLKEMPDYKVNSGSTFLDLFIDCTISLNEGEKYKIGILLTKFVVEQLMNDLGFSSANAEARLTERSNIDIGCLSDIKINITAELGRAQVPIKYALELVGGSIVELDTQNNADIKVYANGVEFAYAQVVAIEENFGLKITKIISPEERLGCVR